MKKFMFASIGLLCLALSALIGFHVGNRTAQAQDKPIRPTQQFENNTPSGIVAMFGLTDMSARFLDENGAVWKCYVTGVNSDVYCWERLGVYDIPIPTSQIKFWAVVSFVTQDDHVFMFREGGWHDCGVWPGGTVSTEQQSWGGVKRKYEKEGD